MKQSLTLSLLCIFPFLIWAQQPIQPFAQLEFWSNYTLPGLAKRIPGNYKETPTSRFEQFKKRHQGFVFKHQVPKEVLENTIDFQDLNPHSFSYEFLLLHHVHTPLGFAAYFLDEKGENPDIVLSYFRDKKGEFASDFSGTHQASLQSGHQKWWYHCVLTFEQGESLLYINGQEVSRKKLVKSPSKKQRLDLAIYSPEPHLHLANVLKEYSLYEGPLSTQEVSQMFIESKKKIAQGIKYKNLFHFLAGPYLHKSDKTSVNILWELNMPANSVLEYGTELPLTNRIEIEEMNSSEKGYEAFIQEITLEGLEVHKKYFYNLKVTNFEGVEMESGIHSFQTAVNADESYQFAAIGDTETRPHVNDQIAKLIWGERPDFVIHMGDLTDGGFKEAKWQWNYEYFEGMGQLHSRIPVFPVPGNGEGKDLYWYQKYHKLGKEEAFYSFTYGNAEFYMMNSVARKEEFKPGGKQYIWLDSALQKSTAQWKFVCMHHAPYSTDENDYGNAYEGKENYGDDYVKTLVPLFEQHRVDIVFFGHLHSYSRMGPIQGEKLNQEAGVWYIQTGGAGGNLEDFGPTRAWFSEKVFAGHHYCLIYVHQGTLLFKMYDLRGNLRDYMEIRKKD